MKLHVEGGRRIIGNGEQLQNRSRTETEGEALNTAFFGVGKTKECVCVCVSSSCFDGTYQIRERNTGYYTLFLSFLLCRIKQDRRASWTILNVTCDILPPFFIICND